MAYNYTNPFQPAASLQSKPTFGSKTCDVLFGGLPPGISEDDLRDWLYGPDVTLSPSTTGLRCIYSRDGKFTGTAVLTLPSEDIAEAFRLKFNEQIVDGIARLSVQHILAPSESLRTFRSLPQFPLQQTANPLQTAVQPQEKPKPKPTPAASSSKAAKPNNKPPGLALLARIQKNEAGGKAPSKEQAALLAKQRANLKNGRPGDALLSRLGRPTTAAAKSKGNKAVSGDAKVGRAKARAGKDAMDVDVDIKVSSAPKKEKPKAKTQADLDAEMAAWERGRRFAQAT